MATPANALFTFLKHPSVAPEWIPIDSEFRMTFVG